MNALFALAFLVSPLRAGVVVPVESGVAPAGPAAPVVPVMSPVGGSLGSPSLGSAADLRGAIPVLPAPAPGLLGPVKHFVGRAVDAAAAAARPEASAAASSPASATALRGRADDRTPSLPASPSPGPHSPAVSLDRRKAGSAIDDSTSMSFGRGEDKAADPAAFASSIDRARPEAAAGAGRRFFDQSDESRRGSLEDPSDPRTGGEAVAAAIPEAGLFGYGRARIGSGLSAASAEAAFGQGHGPSRDAVSYAPEGEALHDAVASAPGGGAPAAGAAVMFRSAAPNGDLARGRSSAASSAVPLPVLGAPSPLALDRAGLIVRVRSAFGGGAAPAAAAAGPERPAVPGPSTALLERGAMLEAFSVAGDLAARAAADAASRPSSPSSREGSSFVPVPETTTAPLWWAWFFLPLFVAAVRGIL